MTSEQQELAQVSQERVERLRAWMQQEHLDAFVVRSNANLRWLTAAPYVFDDEIAHTGLITHNNLYINTDSRYYQTFLGRLGEDGIWDIQMAQGASAQNSHPEWLAHKIKELNLYKTGLEATETLGFFSKLSEALATFTHCQPEQLLPPLPWNLWANAQAKRHGDQSLTYEFPFFEDVIEDLRIQKDQQELELLQRAQDVSDLGLRHIVAYMKAGMTEKQVAQELERYMKEHGADDLSFATILASGPNGALPHAQPGDRKLQEADLVVIDFGALVGEYHADMTRTVSMGEPTQEQLEAYNAVRAAHENTAKAVKPGVNGKEIHNIAADTLDKAGYGEYFNHGLGHGVGLEIHENPCFAPRWDKPVPENSVVTIEPGVYLPGEFGIRLEDTGVVTKDGFKPFTHIGHDLLIAGSTEL